MSKKNSSVKKAQPALKATPTKVVASPVTLGTKRHCSHCLIKFYDFGKTEIHCPKCERVIDPNAQPTFRLKSESRKTAPARGQDFEDSEDIVVESPAEADETTESGELTQEVEVEDNDE